MGIASQGNGNRHMKKTIKSRKVFTEKFFRTLLKNYPKKESVLLAIAKYRKRERGFIQGLNKLVADLPPEVKRDPQFLSRITSVRDDDFRGALGELVTHYVLKRTKAKPYWGPKIGRKTPDFFCESENHSFPTEVFCIGPTKEEEGRYLKSSMLSKELISVRSKFKIFVQGQACLDNTGNLHGLGKSLGNFLKSKRKFNPKDVHRISTPAGASLRFTVHSSKKRGPVVWGSLETGWRGDKYSDLILNNLKGKVDNYRFPFVASCVVGPNSRANLEDLLEALIGGAAVSISIDLNNPSAKGKTAPTNTYLGFWGFKNKEFERHHLVQGVLFIFLSNAEPGLSLHCYFVENPYFKNRLHEVFEPLPDPLKQKKTESTKTLAHKYKIS